MRVPPPAADRRKHHERPFFAFPINPFPILVRRIGPGTRARTDRDRLSRTVRSLAEGERRFVEIENRAGQDEVGRHEDDRKRDQEDDFKAPPLSTQITWLDCVINLVWLHGLTLCRLKVSVQPIFAKARNNVGLRNFPRAVSGFPNPRSGGLPIVGLRCLSYFASTNATKAKHDREQKSDRGADQFKDLSRL